MRRSSSGKQGPQKTQQAITLESQRVDRAPDDIGRQGLAQPSGEHPPRLISSSSVRYPDRNRNTATDQLRNGLATTEAAQTGRQCMSTTAAIAAPRSA